MSLFFFSNLRRYRCAYIYTYISPSAWVCTRLFVSTQDVMRYQLASLLYAEQKRYFWIHDRKWERANCYYISLFFPDFSYFTALFAIIHTYTQTMSDNQQETTTTTTTVAAAAEGNQIKVNNLLILFSFTRSKCQWTIKTRCRTKRCRS